MRRLVGRDCIASRVHLCKETAVSMMMTLPLRIQTVLPVPNPDTKRRGDRESGRLVVDVIWGMN